MILFGIALAGLGMIATGSWHLVGDFGMKNELVEKTESVEMKDDGVLMVDKCDRGMKELCKDGEIKFDCWNDHCSEACYEYFHPRWRGPKEQCELYENMRKKVESWKESDRKMSEFCSAEATGFVCGSTPKCKNEACGPYFQLSKKDKYGRGFLYEQAQWEIDDCLGRMNTFNWIAETTLLVKYWNFQNPALCPIYKKAQAEMNKEEKKIGQACSLKSIQPLKFLTEDDVNCESQNNCVIPICQAWFKDKNPENASKYYSKICPEGSNIFYCLGN